MIIQNCILMSYVDTIILYLTFLLITPCHASNCDVTNIFPRTSGNLLADQACQPLRIMERYETHIFLCNADELMDEM